MTGTHYSSLRSVLESPVLDERKWAKLPTVPCDAVLVDMEDAVPLDRKPEGRARVLEVLQDRSYFGNRVVIPRPNHLSTPWGLDDVIGLARAGIECVLYPKVRSVGEVAQLQRILRERGSDPDIIVCIETPQAVAQVEAIAAFDKVVGLSFGEGDLSADLGIPIHLPDGEPNPTITAARARTMMAGAAAEVARFDFAAMRVIKDLDEFRMRANTMALLGATTICTIYPPHVPIVNEVFTPTDAQIADAQDIIDRIDGARASGAPAIQLEDGRTLLIHDYAKAQRVLDRAGRRA